MIKVDIDSIRYKVKPELQKYVLDKVNSLERVVPRHARKSAHAEVKLKQQTVKTKNEYECEIVLFLPNENIYAKDYNMNMYAAVDVVQAKLRSQLEKYRQSHAHSFNLRDRLKIRRFVGKIRSR